MEKHYTHLSSEERGLIIAERHQGMSGAEIARMLGRSPSKISRELRRNASCSVIYNASEAGAAYRERRCAFWSSIKAGLRAVSFTTMFIANLSTSSGCRSKFL